MDKPPLTPESNRQGSPDIHAPTRQDQLERQAAELAQQVRELEAANLELSVALAAAESARVRAQQEVRAHERTTALLDAALASAPIGIALLDRQLRYLRVNEAIAAITGVAVADHAGRTLREVNPGLNDDLEAALRRALETGQPYRGLALLRDVASAPGKPRHLMLNVYPMQSDAGEMLGLGVAVVDTTERVELLGQFHHSQKMEAVGRLAAGIAHDFNNLLTVIRSYCDLVLLELPASGGMRDELLEIRSAADRAALLARQMLAMSRKQAVIAKPVAVGEIITDLEPMLRRIASQHVEFELRLDPSLGVVRLDPTNFEQILMNLVINAVDAMPTGGRILLRATNVVLDAEQCRRHPDARPGQYVLLTVSDTGTGMDDETMRRIFEPFFTTKQAGKGTGLGLATVLGIVNHLGGHLRVESKLNQGTTFRIYLPREVADGGGEPGTAAMPAPPVPRGTEILLLVQDEDALRASLDRSLRRQGYTVIGASHGGEALRLLAERRQPIDLVLTDLHMPGMDGRDLVSRLETAHPGTKALFMSGSSGDSRAAQGIDPTRHDFIEKPFSMDDLARKVREVLDNT